MTIERTEEEKQESRQFWDSIIRNPDGTMNEEQLYKELSDFSFLIEQAGLVYCHVANLGKVTHFANTIISEADRHYSEVYKDVAKEFLKDMHDIGYIGLKQDYKAMLEELENHF